MKQPGDIFQNISLRRRVTIAMGMLAILVVVIGLFGLAAIMETNHRLHRSVVQAQEMAKAIETARLAQVHLKKQVQEWKDILLRGHSKDLVAGHLKAFDQEERKVQACLQDLLQITANAELPVPNIKDTIRQHEKLGRQYREALSRYSRLDFQAIVAIDQNIRGIDRQLTDDMDAIADGIKTMNAKKIKGNRNDH